MTSLADGGDVAGAIQYGRTHELSRRQEVGAQPDPAVAALLGNLTRGGWRSALPESGGQPDTANPPSSAAPRDDSIASRRRVRRRWIAGVAGLAFTALALWILPPILAGRAAFPLGSVIVMADPVDLTGDSSLARALASAAAVGLQQSRHVTLLSRARITDALRRMGRAGDLPLTDSLAVEVAARANARAVFALTVAKVSGHYALTARLLSPSGGDDIAVHTASAARLDGVIDALDGLIRKIQAGAGDLRSYRDSLPSLPLVTTRSLEALKLYGDGLEAFRHAKYDHAEEVWQRAVALDSGFALAHVALGSLYYLGNNRPGGDSQYSAALRFRSRLSFREQLSLDSRLAGARGNRAEETRIDAILAERYPSRETWYNYGTGLMRAHQCHDAIPALQRALSFDSTFASTQTNIGTCYSLMGENRLALDAYAAAERADSMALLTNFINHQWGSVFVRLGRYAEAEAAFRRMLALREPNDQARGYRSLAYLDMLRGRYLAAIDHLTHAVALSQEPGAGLSLLRNELLLADAYLVRDAPKSAGRELDEALRVSRTQYVEPGFLAQLGRELVRANRIGDAHAVLKQLESVLKPDNATDRSARGLLTAELALARKAPEAAADAMRNDLDPQLQEWRAELIGRVLTERGMLDSALAATVGFARLDAFGLDIQRDWVLAPLDVAGIAEALGDSATARAALQSLLDRWKDADPDLRVLRDARLHLARLRGKAGG